MKKLKCFESVQKFNFNAFFPITYVSTVTDRPIKCTEKFPLFRLQHFDSLVAKYQTAELNLNMD